MPLSLLPARMGAGKARYRVKGLVPCGFLGQGPKPSESIGPSFLFNICSFQGSKEPFSFAQFFHRSLDTISYLIRGKCYTKLLCIQIFIKFLYISFLKINIVSQRLSLT